jgi:predicted AlkP superfamily pyrophosphatase or phosphodiesterase
MFCDTRPVAMYKFRLLIAFLVLPALLLSTMPLAWGSAYDGHPKLIVILVIDQFRADYLDRYRADFKGRGFRLFLDKGAYFEDCYYDYANTKTAPGHSTIGTGAYTDGHGISSNEWWDLDRNKTRPVSSVEDDRYHIVGAPHPSQDPGASPFNLRASTVGDSLRQATMGQSKLFGISLKDRAAILPAGYSANGAYWIDAASGAYITSSYYMDSLPDWVTAFNSGSRPAQARQEAGVQASQSFFDSVGPTPAANAYELDFARALITGEQLGSRPVTDMLTISLSATDLLGHHLGPDSAAERQMVDSLDVQLDSFFSWLDKNVPGGLADIWVTLSADHGVAPVPSQAIALGLPAASIDLNAFVTNLNDAMNAKFSPGEKVAYLLPHQELPYLSLNRPSFDVAGINEQEAEQAIQQAVPAAMAALAPAPGTLAPKAAQPTPPPPVQAPPPATPAPGSTKRSRSRAAAARAAAAAHPVKVAPPPPPVTRLVPVPIVVHTYTRDQLAAGQLPPSEWGLLLAHSYSPNGGWYVMVIPEAYQMQTSGTGTTHFTPYSYDRHVPLGFFGAPFLPGTYHGRVQPVDLAVTLASMLGINQPSAAVGNVLTQALRPASTTSKGSRTKSAASDPATPPTP